MADPINKKRKLSAGECPVPKRPKLEYDCRTVTAALSLLEEKHQMELRDFFVKKYPIYSAEFKIVPTRTFLGVDTTIDNPVQRFRNTLFLIDLVATELIGKDDPYTEPYHVTNPRGCVNIVTRLITALIPYIQATHFFLAKGDDASTRCIMEPCTIDDETIYLPAFKNFECDTEDHVESFMDPDDYEFFRDHCHEWIPDKLKQILESPGFVPNNTTDDFTFCIGVINKHSKRFLLFNLEFVKLVG
jgi:hypothetical protein